MDEIKVFYIDDDITRYMREALNGMEIELNDKKYVVKCEYMSYDISNSLNNIQQIINRVKQGNYLCLFIDNKLYDENQKDKTKGIWVAYVLKSQFPFLNFFIVSSKKNEKDSFTNNNFPFLEKISKDVEEELLNDYKTKIIQCLQDKLKMDEAVSLYKKVANDLPSQIDDAMKILISNMENNNYDEFISSDELKKIITLLEEAINNG